MKDVIKDVNLSVDWSCASTYTEHPIHLYTAYANNDNKKQASNRACVTPFWKHGSIEMLVIMLVVM